MFMLPVIETGRRTQLERPVFDLHRTAVGVVIGLEIERNRIADVDAAHIRLVQLQRAICGDNASFILSSELAGSDPVHTLQRRTLRNGLQFGDRNIGQRDVAIEGHQGGVIAVGNGPGVSIYFDTLIGFAADANGGVQVERLARSKIVQLGVNVVVNAMRVGLLIEISNFAVVDGQVRQRELGLTVGRRGLTGRLSLTQTGVIPFALLVAHDLDLRAFEG